MTPTAKPLPRPFQRLAGSLGLLLATTLGACAADRSAPLDQGPHLADSPSRLVIDPSKLRLTALAAHRFDPSDGLDPIEVATLAVLNNPDLQARRVAYKVVAAQAFSAGLLPDPQLALNLDSPVSPGPGLVTAYGVSPSIDLVAIITHSAALKAARASERQADLQLLWQEWSVAEQARALAVTVLFDEQKAAALQTLSKDIDERLHMSAKAYQRGDVAAPPRSADVAARLDADVQAATAAKDAAKARGDLNALLGLTPSVALNLVEGATDPEPQPAEMDAALGALSQRRPDLLALQAGYSAQQANVRKAILSQFPVINLGFSRARDTSNITTNGGSATLVIPIFNRNRGEISVQAATRDQLAAEYRARLDQTTADVAAARRELEEARVVLDKLEAEVPALEAMVARAAPAYARGDLDSGGYLALQQAAINKRAALIDQRLAVRLADIGVQTVLFLPMGSSESQPR